MAEHALQFGPAQRLMGMLNLPDTRLASPDEVAFLMLNVGVTQRIGPRRLNVKLARSLAAQGGVSLRLDLSGMGDSGAAGPGDDYRQQAVADLQAAMDAVTQRTGIQRFVVLGICSGAVNGYRVAVADPRVVGLMMFDGYAYPGRATRWIHDWRRLTHSSAEELLQKVRQRLDRLLGRPPSQAKPVSIFYVTRDAQSPDREAFGRAMEALVARGVRVLIGYSGSLLALYNHHGQFAQTFAGQPWLPQVRCDYMPEIDHTPTTQAGQAQFLRWVGEWAAGWMPQRTL